MVSKLSPVKRCGSQRESSILPARVRACAEIAGKTTSRPRGRTRERSQCSSAMGCSDEASQRYFGGGRVGLTDVRESRHCSKHGVSPWEPPDNGSADTVVGLIGCVASSSEENGPLTIPVKPHGVLTRCQVKLTYKLMVKWKAEAPGRGRQPQQPPLQGWQQTRSMPPRAERRNRRERGKTAGHTRKVSNLTKATKWPTRASARASQGTLRNIPKQAWLHSLAVALR